MYTYTCSFTAPSPSGGRMRDTIDDGDDDTPGTCLCVME